MATLSGFKSQDSIHVTEKTFVQSVATGPIKSCQHRPFPLFRLERLEDRRIRFSYLCIELEDTS